MTRLAWIELKGRLHCPGSWRCRISSTDGLTNAKVINPGSLKHAGHDQRITAARCGLQHRSIFPGCPARTAPFLRIREGQQQQHPLNAGEAPAHPRPPLHSPTRPWPWLTCPLSFRVFLSREGCGEGGEGPWARRAASATRTPRPPREPRSRAPWRTGLAAPLLPAAGSEPRLPTTLRYSAVPSRRGSERRRLRGPGPIPIPSHPLRPGRSSHHLASVREGEKGRGSRETGQRRAGRGRDLARLRWGGSGGRSCEGPGPAHSPHRSLSAPGAESEALSRI